MAASMIGPKFYAWDRNGKPLAFGKLYTYQARTNTPKPTYQSEDQVVENANPVILNGEGYANVYLDGSYKMVLKDDKDNEIWSSDPVTSAQATEWVNCHSASYVSPTLFSIPGNHTEEYTKERKVRINNNSSSFEYSSVVESSYSSGQTTVEVLEPVVSTGITEACTSVVSARSSFNNEDLALYSWLTFNSVEDMIKTEAAIGTKVSTTGRYQAMDGGGANYLIVPAGTGVDDGGAFIDSDDNSKQFQLIIDGGINASNWGVVGNGDESAQMQNVLNFAFNIYRIDPDLPGTDHNAAPFIKMLPRQFLINDVILPKYSFIDGDNCTFQSDENGTCFLGDPDGFRWHIKNVQHFGVNSQFINAPMNNLNDAEFIFEKIVFAGRIFEEDRYAINIASRSAVVTLKDCNAKVCPNVLRSDCDFTYLVRGWYQAFMETLTGNNAPTGARFDIVSGLFSCERSVFIPEPQGAVRNPNARWFNRRGASRLYFKDAHFGAENAGIPIIYDFGTFNYDNGSRTSDSVITFDGGTVSCGSSGRPDSGIIVLQDGVLPGVVSIKNTTKLGLAPVINAYGYDPAGDADSRNTLMRANLRAQPFRITQNIELDIVESWKTLIPECLYGYNQRFAIDAPSKQVKYDIAEVFKQGSNSVGFVSYDSCVITVSANLRVTSGRYSKQEKEFLVTNTSLSADPLDLSFLTKSFFETENPDALGDNVLTLVKSDAAATNTLAGLSLYIDNASVASIDSVTIEISDIKSINGVISGSKSGKFRLIGL